MKIFKAIYSPIQMFSFQGGLYESSDGIIKVKDSDIELYEYLKQNSTFIEINSEDEIEDIQVEIPTSLEEDIEAKKKKKKSE